MQQRALPSLIDSHHANFGKHCESPRSWSSVQPTRSKQGTCRLFLRLGTILAKLL